MHSIMLCMSLVNYDKARYARAELIRINSVSRAVARQYVDIAAAGANAPDANYSLTCG